MRSNEIFTEDMDELFEILNRVLPYKLTDIKRFRDLVYSEYLIDSDEPLLVGIQSLIFEDEKIAEVSFYHPDSEFKQLNRFDVGGVSGIIATVIDICKNTPYVNVWYFSAKMHPYTTAKELSKRSSLYLRVSKRLAAELGLNFRTFSAMGNNFFVLSKDVISNDKIKRYIDHIK